MARSSNTHFFTLKAKRQLRKAIIPAAGLGTRMQRLTKGQPKEMLPIGGKPMIFYAIQEAALCGLEEIYIVINERKAALRRYLESADLQRAIQPQRHGQIISLPRLRFVDQPLPLGTGDAIYRTRELIGEEPFGLMMPDFVFFGRTPALSQMIALYERFKRDIVGVISIGTREAEGFGNVGIIEGREQEPGIIEVYGLSGKDASPLTIKEGAGVIKAAPRWILDPHFFSYVERTKSHDGEWDDIPALQLLCKERGVVGKVLEGKGFDVGNPEGYEAAMVSAAELDARYKR